MVSSCVAFPGSILFLVSVAQLGCVIRLLSFRSQQESSVRFLAAKVRSQCVRGRMSYCCYTVMPAI